ncbi:MAG: VirE protein [Bacteroidaceae bacterium]|nr:VirE protein [Bacteroidaceae bacterium]
MSFGIAKDIRSEVRECTPDLLAQALDSPQVARTCAEIEDALEKFRRGEITMDEYETLKAQLKKRLPIITFHATFKNGRRKNDEAIPSGLSIYDLDHIPNPRSKWEEIEPRKEELGILLSHISPSLEGLRLVFVMPQGMDLAQAQAWMAEQLGDKQYDSCVKDYARCSFVVPREYVLYMSDDLFRHGSHGFHGTHPLPNEADAHLEDADNAQAVKESVSSNQPKATETQGHEKPCDPCHPCQKEEFPQAYEGISYETIVETLEEQMGGQPEHGSRNNFIFSMACHLRYICNDDPDWIAQVMPDYGEARSKWMASIRSACNRNQTKAMPRIMKRTIAICKQRIEENSELETHNSELENTPPAMPKRLPPLIKLLVSRTPDIYKPAVAHAVFPALATHLWKVRFRYIDNVEHEATLMNVLMAGTGAGKDCISAPINYIMADIRKRDRENMLREKEWKKEMNTKGANKDKRDRPQGLVIQEIDADMTNPAFCMRTNEAEEHFLYTKMNEIDQFDALKGNGKNGGQQFQIMCLAFDPGNLYGQTRASAQSVSERVTIRFNWNASTTILKGQRYFRNVLTDGPISRINFCTIPEREIGADIPVYGSYDAAFEEELRPYIEHLTHATGLIECKQAFSLARKLKDENAEKSRLTQSRVFENLSFRANVIAYLKAMVLYVAHGYRWDKTMEDFVRWSLQYDLWCKMEFFGAAIEEAMQGAVKRRTPGRQNLLELLGNEFTLRDAENVRVKQGMDTKGTRNMLNQWKHRGYILQMTNDNYKKSENYKTK